MRNIITMVVITLVAFLGLVDAGLIDAGNLTAHNTPELQRNKNDSNPTIFNLSELNTNCYSIGSEWADLGDWQDVYDALQISGIMRVNDIPAGYHVCYPHRQTLSRFNTEPSNHRFLKTFQWDHTATSMRLASIRVMHTLPRWTTTRAWRWSILARTVANRA